MDKCLKKIMPDAVNAYLTAFGLPSIYPGNAMEIIGEAVKHIPVDVRLSNPSIPWESMAEG